MSGTKSMEETIKQLQAEVKEKTRIIEEQKQVIIDKDRQIYFLRNEVADRFSVGELKTQNSDLRGIYENNHAMWMQDFRTYTLHFHDRIDELHKLIEENLSPRKRKFVKEDRPSPWA